MEFQYSASDRGVESGRCIVPEDGLEITAGMKEIIFLSAGAYSN